MSNRVARWTGSLVLTAGVIGGCLAVPAVASADTTPPAPSTTVTGTTCTVTQIEEEIATRNPKRWARLEAHPKAKAHFEVWLTESQPDRDAQLARLQAKHPNTAAKRAARYAKLQNEINTLAPRCSMN